MKKRLRKKKHVGEYREWGRQFVIYRNRRDGFDESLDAFLEEAIEANGCFCGGGGKEDLLDVIVELGTCLPDTVLKQKRIVQWLKKRSDVKEWRTGEMFDLWYGTYTDINEDENGAYDSNP